MEKEILIQYLENEDNNFNEKYRYIDGLNLNYSTLFELLDYFEGTEVHKVLSTFISYDNPTLKNKLRKYYREEKEKRNNVYIRRKFYGNY